MWLNGQLKQAVPARLPGVQGRRLKWHGHDMPTISGCRLNLSKCDRQKRSQTGQEGQPTAQQVARRSPGFPWALKRKNDVLRAYMTLDQRSRKRLAFLTLRALRGVHGISRHGQNAADIRIDIDKVFSSTRAFQ